MLALHASAHDVAVTIPLMVSESWVTGSPRQDFVWLIFSSSVMMESKCSMSPHSRKIFMTMKLLRRGWGQVAVYARDYGPRYSPLGELSTQGVFLSHHRGLTSTARPDLALVICEQL